MNAGPKLIAYGLTTFKCPHCGTLTELDLLGFDARGPDGTLCRMGHDEEKVPQ